MNESRLIKDDSVSFTKAFGYICKVYIGLNPDNIAVELIKVFYNELINKYPTITFNDFYLSFSETKFKKKEGVSLTVGELLEYVDSFIKKKNIIINQLNECIEKQKESELEKLKIIEFENECLSIFENHCQSKMDSWNGSDIQAYIPALSIANNIQQQIKNNLFKNAKDEYNQRLFDLKNNPKNISVVVPVKYIYSRMLLNEYLCNYNKQ